MIRLYAQSLGQFCHSFQSSPFLAAFQIAQKANGQIGRNRQLHLRHAVQLETTAAIGILASCADGNDNNVFLYNNVGNNARKNLKYLDLSNAKSLYISGSSGTSANNAAKSLSDTQNTQKMFKITKEGYIQEVKYLDENKKEITITQRPTAIHPINDNYICVGFGWSVGDMNTCYLVRKSDGAVFDMEKAGRPKKK